ncbi:MAG: hypothetical protein J5953_12975 [Prevotella sp.]|nr:hypothetical protein [Prevotella sp.]
MWLKTDGKSKSGSLVWKDVSTDIVTDLAVSGDFLTFSVPQSAIMQGNAVVAVKDGDGKIMWSWHLWFTDSGALSGVGSYGLYWSAVSVNVYDACYLYFSSGSVLPQDNGHRAYGRSVRPVQSN